MFIMQWIRYNRSEWNRHTGNLLKKTPKHLCSVCVLKVNCLGILVGLRMLKLRIHRAQRWKGKWYNQDPVFLICNSSWWAYVGNQLWLKASQIRLYPRSLKASAPDRKASAPYLHLGIHRHMRGHSGLYMEVFHFKCQNNFPLACWKPVLKVICHLWHQWTQSNLQRGLGLLWTCCGTQMLQTISKNAYNTVVSSISEAIPVSVICFLK